MTDWQTLPLAGEGRSLVEASAGTGKTWTISVLYLRLLLEQPLSPRQIVVTTFSNAAAGELRERLRGRLLWAQRQNAAGHAAEADSDDQRWLQQRWQDAASRRADGERLQVALAELDRAPIGTLHGLCRRILSEHPFASGALFELGKLADGAALTAQIADDLWRRLQQGDERCPMVAALRHSEACGQRIDQAYLRNATRLLLGAGVQAAGALAPTLQALPLEWAGRLREYSSSDQWLASTSKLKRGWKKLADWMQATSLAVPEQLIDDLAAAIDGTGVKKSVEKDPGILAARQFTEHVCLPHLRALRQAALQAPLLQIGAAARELLRQRLLASHSLRFDDLLGDVHAALHGSDANAGAATLADALFAAWPVALVDEFQDTDRLQYGILDRIYRDSAQGVRGRLLMIGDPKQAIYRFRGGDIHAYQRAAASAAAADRLSLAVNHRSSRRLVAAFNDWYQRAGSALSASDDGHIHYQEVAASDRQDSQPYCIDQTPVRQPLTVHCLNDPPDTLEARRNLALHTCANQIADLLASGRHRIGERPLQPSDIAVLLPNNRQLEQLRQLLTRRGVRSVSTSRSSVFDSDSARDLQVVLHAIAHADAPGCVRAALATPLWACDWSDLVELQADNAAWQRVGERFRGYWQRWQRLGVQAVVHQLIELCAPRYLQQEGGERRLTDLRQLGELLQAQEQLSPGAEELLAWLHGQRESDSGGNEDSAEARQLRIESDAQRVRLMTLHASKGLEFSVVYLPLMWDHRARIDKTGLYQRTDPDNGVRLLDSSDAAREEDLGEQQDEGFRVFYVALTRAIHACHLFVVDPRQPPARAGARSALEVMLARMQPPYGTVDAAATDAAVAWIDGWLPLQRVDCWSADEVASERRARPLPPPSSGALPGKHSFTTLTQSLHNQASDPEAAANDELESAPGAALPAGEATVDTIAPAAPEALPHPALLALAAVRGTQFGNAVHAIFEQRSIGHSLLTQTALITEQLQRHDVRASGMDGSELVMRLARRLQAVLETPLLPEGGPTLAALPAADLRAEMEFHFALDGASLQQLRLACREHADERLIPGQRGALAGLMTGKIDLLFRHAGRIHVLDYKGNWLGEHCAQYQGVALQQAMDAAHYRFQALLYTLAVDRYLRSRIDDYRRDRHLGDCWYLFVRAVGLAPAAGIFRQRFSDALLDAAQDVLARSSMEAA